MMRRRERKFVVPDGASALVGLRTHMGGWRELYPPRQVNSLYFDSPDWSCLRANLDGDPARRKVRVRWYGAGDAPGVGAKLEIKSRHGVLGDKVTYVFDGVPPWPLGAGWAGDRSWPAPVRALLAGLRPVLLNTYWRMYFFSPALPPEELRLTLDTRLGFRTPPAASFLRRDHAVVEVKSAPELPAIEMPWREARHSKYVLGVLATGAAR